MKWTKSCGFWGACWIRWGRSAGIETFSAIVAMADPIDSAGRVVWRAGLGRRPNQAGRILSDSGRADDERSSGDGGSRCRRESVARSGILHPAQCVGALLRLESRTDAGGGAAN